MKLKIAILIFSASALLAKAADKKTHGAQNDVASPSTQPGPTTAPAAGPSRSDELLSKMKTLNTMTLELQKDPTFRTTLKDNDVIKSLIEAYKKKYPERKDILAAVDKMNDEELRHEFEAVLGTKYLYGEDLLKKSQGYTGSSDASAKTKKTIESSTDKTELLKLYIELPIFTQYSTATLRGESPPQGLELEAQEAKSLELSELAAQKLGLDALGHLQAQKIGFDRANP